MVDKPSATLSSDSSHDHIPIDGNHSTIVKFTSSADPGYKCVVQRLEQCIQTASNVVERRKVGASGNDERFKLYNYGTLGKLPHIAGASFNYRRLHHEPICLNGTREDVLHRIRLWTREPESACICWLSGMAGTGMSTIARTAARQFYKDKQLGASFFFSRGAGELAKTAKLFTTFAYQLARLNPRVHEAICAAISKHEDIAKHSLRDQWKHLIQQPLSCLGDATTQRHSVVIVIDALTSVKTKMILS
ncbi:hypothetical protein FPQ18DRAFT_17904 [Pyronema domesticum]|nr:hypothetical protein FPQ18DRAFT_17904 [Pyronema domesticum]